MFIYNSVLNIVSPVQREAKICWQDLSMICLYLLQAGQCSVEFDA